MARAITGAVPVPVPPPIPAVMNTICDPAIAPRISGRDFRRGALADLRLCSSAQTLRQFGAKLDFVLRLRQQKRLRVGVGDNKADAFETRIDHVVDGIAASAADTQNGDPRLEFFCLLAAGNWKLIVMASPPCGEAMNSGCAMMRG